jgi:hypothetical protein
MTVCVNEDCISNNLTADTSGDHEGVLIAALGTMTVTVVDETTGKTSTFSFEVTAAN